jgi:S-DNA-T family DNA segregation ATPase FtsK/SpoIIIE
MSFETATTAPVQRKSALSALAPFFRRKQVQEAATWGLLGVGASLLSISVGIALEPLTHAIGWAGVSALATVGTFTTYQWMSGDIVISRVIKPSGALVFVAVPVAASLVYGGAGGVIGNFIGALALTGFSTVMPLDWAIMTALTASAVAVSSLVVLAQLPVVRLMAWGIGMYQAWMYERQVEPSVTSSRSRESSAVAPTAKVELKQTALTAILEKHGIAGATENGIINGHVVSRHIIQLPMGTKTSSLPLADIARDMRVKAVSLDQNIGGGCIGLDVPAKTRKPVVFADLLKSKEWANRTGTLPACPAIDVAGNPVVIDIAKLPHLIVAGTTGSGKSVFVNACILSLMDSGEDFRLIIADGKGEDFAPHYCNSGLLMQGMSDDDGDIPAIATDAETIKRQVLWLTAEMDRRFSEQDKPYPILFVTDELADIIMQDGKDKAITKALARIAQKARSAMIHMILATQYPTSKVIDPILAANTPSRAGLLVDKDHQSRVVIGENGCETLLGMGDCLLKIAGHGITRVHGALITDDIINEYLK